MQIACSSWSLHREIPGNLSLLNFPAWCGSQGISAIEVVDNQFPAMDKKFLTEFQRACEHAGVTLSCLAISNDFTIADDDQLFAQIERVRFLLYDVAQHLKIPTVRAFLGTADPSKDGDQRALNTFRTLRPDLETTGIVMALENHGRSASPEQMLGIISGVDNRFFGACIDFGNWSPERRYDAILELAPLAKHVHAKSYDFDANGEETTIDYKRALAALTEAGYDGIISIEYEGRDDPYQGTLKTKGLIEQYWYYPQVWLERKAA